VKTTPPPGPLPQRERGSKKGPAAGVMSPAGGPPSPRGGGGWGEGLVLAWSLLLAAVLIKPHFFPEMSLGEDLVRHTARLALLFALPAALLMLHGAGRPARLCWSLAWVTYLVHVGLAFHHAHGWSHAQAVAHVERRSGLGAGIWLSHLFTLAWTADVIWWWLRPEGRAARPAWVGALLYGYMAFMTFNATVVYEAGLIRWAGLAFFAALAVAFLLRRLSLSVEASQ